MKKLKYKKEVKMEIHLETDEILTVFVDGTCEYKVWGERNEEGTMIIKWKNKNWEKKNE